MNCIRGTPAALKKFVFDVLAMVKQLCYPIFFYDFVIRTLMMKRIDIINILIWAKEILIKYHIMIAGECWLVIQYSINQSINQSFILKNKIITKSNNLIKEL